MNLMKKPILILGATGYVGGRLIPRLLEAGYNVRAVSRSISKLRGRPWSTHPNVEIIAADVLDKVALKQAMLGCGIVYYLVHSMDSNHKNFVETDYVAAQNVTKAAEESKLERIIYLGGLGEDSPDLSKHLRSRAEVAQVLKEGTIPVTVLRAAMIIGSGSASFEILRYLVDRLPIMVTPKWVCTPSQPIAIRDVLGYLMGCLIHPNETMGKTFDIGGPNIITYRELMEIYAEEAGLPKRWIIPVPVFTPKLSSYWIHLVTPVPAFIARPLADGLKNPAICHEHSIQKIIPQPLLSCREAIQLALKCLRDHTIETHWTDAGSLPPVETVYPGDPSWAGGAVYKDQREIIIDATIEDVWQQVVKIGGETGWYYGDFLWHLRGSLDRLMGGVGHERGRRNPTDLRQGDALDFWRVLDLQIPTHLKLLAEMKLPGTAILDFQLTLINERQTQLTQTAWFVPSGLTGILYWYSVMPLHDLIFNGMLQNIAKASCGKQP